MHYLVLVRNYSLGRGDGVEHEFLPYGVLGVRHEALLEGGVVCARELVVLLRVHSLRPYAPLEALTIS